MLSEHRLHLCYIRERDRVIGETLTPVLKKYERICFEKQVVRQHGKPMADLIHPGHPLMQAITARLEQRKKNWVPWRTWYQANRL